MTRKPPIRKIDNKSTVFAKDFSIFDAPIIKEKLPENDFKEIIDETKIFKQTVVDDRKNPLDQTLPVLVEIVKEIGHNNPKQILSKYEVFVKVMENLEDEYTRLVDGHLLMQELEKTGVFSHLKARSYITQMYRNRIIEEPKGGFFRLI